jgi:hypothetical protein
LSALVGDRTGLRSRLLTRLLGCRGRGNLGCRGHLNRGRGRSLTGHNVTVHRGETGETARGISHRSSVLRRGETVVKDSLCFVVNKNSQILAGGYVVHKGKPVVARYPGASSSDYRAGDEEVNDSSSSVDEIHQRGWADPSDRRVDKAFTSGVFVSAHVTFVNVGHTPGAPKGNGAHRTANEVTDDIGTVVNPVGTTKKPHSCKSGFWTTGGG